MPKASMRPQTPLLIMAAVHVVAVIVFIVLVGLDAGKVAGAPDRFTAAAAWFLAGIFLAPVVTVGAVVWSVILRRHSRTTAPQMRRQHEPTTGKTAAFAVPPVEAARAEPRPETYENPSRAGYTTRAEARAAAADTANTATEVRVTATGALAPPARAPRLLRPGGDLAPYILLGSDKYKATEVEGVFARTSEIAKVIKSLTGRVLRLDEEVEIPDVAASLRTEPANRYHRRAIMVIIDGLHVGYVAREDADRYHPSMSRIEAAGYTPTTRARLWAVQRQGWDGPPKVHARVSLALNEPHLLIPVNEPPTVAYSLLPWGNAVQVTGEENHLDAIAPHVNLGSESIAIGTLHRVETTSARGVAKQLVDVRIDGRAVGSLTATTSPHYLPTIQHLELGGLVAAAWVKVKGSAIAAQVTVQAARPPELPPEWFSAPTLIQPLPRATP